MDNLQDLERRVEQIWRDVLETPDSPPSATFFELQGQSLSAVRITARIEDELSIVVDVGDLFEDPSMAAFVRAVVAKAVVAKPAA